MKIGIASVNVGGRDGAAMVRLGQAAEAAGVESFWTFEHVVVPESYESPYPYSRDGKMPVTPETPFADPLISLAHLAGATTTLRLATGVNIAPQANPLLLAKQVASLDFLSGGRLILGLGAGWLKEEYDAMGVPFSGRGRRFDDYIEAMKKVWSGDTVEHHSSYLNWSGFKSFPLPVQRPHPPLIIGGTSDAAFRRVASYGDGWFAPSRNIDDLRGMCTRLREELKRVGRPPGEIEISAMWGPGTEGMEFLSQYRELGVSRLVVPLHLLPNRDPEVGMNLLCEQVHAAL